MNRPDVSKMDLRVTAPLMESADYRERMLAEYWQTKIRYERLKKLTTRLEAEKVKLQPGLPEQKLNGTPAEVLQRQQAVMGEYLHILELRAACEGVAL